MKNNLNRKINFLTGYAIVTTLAFGTIAFSSFSAQRSVEKIDEITVKRLNLVGEDGSLRMVMSNETRQHSGRMNGKDMAQRERPAGIIFFNNSGDECGGLIYKNKEKDGKVNSGMSFTMDNYHDDQVIQILNDEYYDNGKASIQRGISINEFPVGSNLEERNKKMEEIKLIPDEKERRMQMRALMQEQGSKNRLFIGRTRGNSSGLFLAGPDGQPKLMIYVDDKGDPRIETFDGEGKTKNYLEGK